MLAKRIIPCLDVKDGVVVKGIQFRGHEVVGDICELALRYSETGADELVFYDITASCDRRTVSHNWISEVSKHINIPFCVAGGIKTLHDAERILNAGADKISINSPALQNPDLINAMVANFGQQCVVIGIDSFEEDGDYKVYQYTGDPNKMHETRRNTLDWALEVMDRGAGEIVLNCMNQDGVRNGYDLTQLNLIQKQLSIPVIASGGAGNKAHFLSLFQETTINAALAASVFHKGIIAIPDLKQYLLDHHIEVRL